MISSINAKRGAVKMRKIKLVIYLFLFVSAFLVAEDESGYIKTKIEAVHGSFVSVKIDGKNNIIKLAPIWYLNQNNWSFKTGDEILLKYIERMGIKSATQVIKDNKIYKFIDDDGEFLWARKGLMGEHRGRGMREFMR